MEILHPMKLGDVNSCFGLRVSAREVRHSKVRHSFFDVCIIEHYLTTSILIAGNIVLERRIPHDASVPLDYHRLAFGID